MKEDDETREPHIETKIQVRNLKPVAGPGRGATQVHNTRISSRRKGSPITWDRPNAQHRGERVIVEVV